MQKLRIVVADDHRLTAHAIADTLNSRGYEVVATCGGVAEALSAVTQYEPDESFVRGMGGATLDRLATKGWSRAVDALGFTRLVVRFSLT